MPTVDDVTAARPDPPAAGRGLRTSALVVLAACALLLFALGVTVGLLAGG